jgi:hypothetical protein
VRPSRSTTDSRFTTRITLRGLQHQLPGRPRTLVRKASASPISLNEGRSTIKPPSYYFIRPYTAYLCLGGQSAL